MLLAPLVGPFFCIHVSMHTSILNLSDVLISERFCSETEPELRVSGVGKWGKLVEQHVQSF